MDLKRMTCIFICGILLFSGCGPSDGTNSAEEKYTEEVFAMDTVMRLSAYGENGKKAVEQAIEEIYRLDTLLSVSSEAGEIYWLNRDNGGSVSEETEALLRRAQVVSEQTDGAFDCTIGPVMEAWGFRDGNFRIPEEAELAGLLALVDSAKVKAEDGTVELSQGMEIDLGGIAKGYTSDRIMEIYRASGVTSGIISLGGNVQAIGKKPDGSLWKIALEDPERPEEQFGILEIADEAVITSGGYQRNFAENGMVYHHIIDPQNGYPAYNGLISVTIVSRDGTLADALTTALFVMGTERAEAFWQAHKSEFQAVLVTKDRTIIVTEGLKDFFTLETEDKVVFLT